MRGQVVTICAKFMGKVSEAAVSFMVERSISFLAKLCWNQTRIKEMPSNFMRLMYRTKRLKGKTEDRSNPTVSQLLSQLENEASEGMELLNGEVTPLQLQKAMKSLEKIRKIKQDLNHALKKNCRESNTRLTDVTPQVLKIKPPQFKPQYQRRCTRIQILMGRKVSSVA